jgi:hypothetical protein
MKKIMDNFDNALESLKESINKKYEPTLSEKLEKIVSKEPSKFWAESDERFKNKQTIEEGAEKRYPFEDGFQVMDIDISEMLQLAFINGAKHQQENSYDKEDMRDSYRSGKIYDMTSFDYWFENYKKK